MIDDSESQLLRQMLDITQRRIDRQRRAVCDASEVHEQAVNASYKASCEMEHAQQHAPLRRKALLVDLMNSAQINTSSGVYSRSISKGPLDAYSKRTEDIQREVAERVRDHNDAEQKRIAQLQLLEAEQHALRDAVIRREKWIALKEEMSQPSFEG